MLKKKQYFAPDLWGTQMEFKFLLFEHYRPDFVKTPQGYYLLNKNPIFLGDANCVKKFSISENKNLEEITYFSKRNRMTFRKCTQ